MKRKTEILILGAGIGGYEAFRSMSRFLKKNKIKKRITLVDRNNYFTFAPMLHEVASGSIQPNQCAIPIRQCIYKTGHEFWQANVEKIQPSKKCVQTSRGVLEYEYCIVAMGSETNYFGVKGAEENSEHVRTLSAAIDLHQKFVKYLESHESNEIDLVFVGGGATGVELAGQFCHLARHDVKKLYPCKSLNIKIVQSGDSILKYANAKVQKYVTGRLKKDGVKILLNARVREVTRSGVVLKGGERVKGDLVVWAAGFENTGVNFLPEKYCKGGQIFVNKFLECDAAPGLFAIGDIAFVDGKDDGYPKLGEVAHKQGALAARNICASILSEEMKSFKYKLKGALIPIGDWYAVADIGPFTFDGRFAWWLRRTVYLMFIPGFLRKLRIVIDWTLHGLGFRHMVDVDFSS